ncbi:MAG: DNA primase, partial [Catenulisporales bacterium]|nr:DNA primase [Catenulisporales bacterium]
MAGRINDDDIERVRKAASIVDVVGAVVQLRNAGGGNLKGLCPFHDEKSPSFQVSPAKNFYHCFGCGVGGDVMKFVMEYDHLTFTEAVERLASQYRIELRYTEGGYTKQGERSERTRLIEAHKVAAEFFVDQLATPAAAKGREFLASRGFDAAAIEKFTVGYAPESWEALVRHLRGRGFTDREILAGGLASEGRRGAMDRFRNRLMWPIADLSGDVIGFGGRRLTDDPDTPKYLNSPETPIYKKSSVLYGLDLARREIVKQERAGGGVHLRRRLGRAEGGHARLSGRGQVRHADLRRRRAGRPGPLRSAAGQGRRGGARTGRDPDPAVRVRHPRRVGQAQPRRVRGPSARSALHRPDRGEDPRFGAAQRLHAPAGRMARAGGARRAVRRPAARGGFRRASRGRSRSRFRRPGRWSRRRPRWRWWRWWTWRRRTRRRLERPPRTAGFEQPPRGRGRGLRWPRHLRFRGFRRPVRRRGGDRSRPPRSHRRRRTRSAEGQFPQLAGATFDGLAPEEFTVPAYAAVCAAVGAAGGCGAGQDHSWTGRVQDQVPD